MIVKKAVFARKMKTVDVRVSDEVYGCDCCKKRIDPNDEAVLRLSIFNNDEDGHTIPSEQKEFCSWKCVIKYLPTIKSNYFVCLPYLHYDNKVPGTRAIDLLNLLTPKK